MKKFYLICIAIFILSISQNAFSDIVKNNITSDERALKLYHQSYQAVESGNYIKGIELSNEALRYPASSNLRAHIIENIAWCYKGLGENDKAIEYLYKALGEDVNAEEPAYNLGVFLYEENRIEEALKALNNFIHNFPNSTNKDFLGGAYAYQGDCLLELGRLKEAEDSFKKSIPLYPSSQAFFGLADVYRLTKNYKEAVPNYTKGLEYEPNRVSNIKRWHQLGFSYWYIGDFEASRSAFRRAIDVFKDNREFIAAGIQFEEAEITIRYYDLAHYAFDSQVWLGRLGRNPEETIKEFEIALTSPEGDDYFIPMDYISILMAYEELDNPILFSQKSNEILERGLLKYPENPDLLFFYADTLDFTNPAVLSTYLKILEKEHTYNPIVFDYETIYNNIAYYYIINMSVH